LYIGEALVGEGNEVAHIDLIIGEKNGPVGNAFAFSLATPRKGHTPLLAVLTPNLQTKPSTLIVPKVTIKTMHQAELIYGSAQAAVAKAVADSVEEGVIPKERTEDWVIVCSVFIHPKAEDKKRIYKFNYEATKLAIRRALSGEPQISEVLERKNTAHHPLE